MNKDPNVYLQHIISAIESILKYTKDQTFQTFKENAILSDAVVRQLEIIGEASKFYLKYASKRPNQIQWTQIIGMRDKIIHGYFAVDLVVVWKTVQNDLFPLKEAISKLLQEGSDA